MPDFHSAQNGQGELWTDTGHMGHEKTKEVSLLGRRKTVKDLRILTHMMMGQHSDFHPGIRELVVTREWNQNLVADAAGIDDDLVWKHIFQYPFDKSDHDTLVSTYLQR